MVELLRISKPIITGWYNHCRQVCKNDNNTHHDSHKLGARIETLDTGETPTIIVQIDECLLRSKRLYNRIEKNGVERTTMIWSDHWAAYNSLYVNGEFHYRTVNHSENFISARGTHTQTCKKCGLL
ncbi:hypothetical protein RF11_12115 [Thelohanellus kitauei]|uniref:ISXO2-like transposase domain-containing protein n=1 Tax=Thelohanellus kitauei TaxID=669202 RepID=A0A0C2JCG5_THEKT|nr:hypothetical protein RF11_12115 [Thelohanellus kitauei]